MRKKLVVRMLCLAMAASMIGTMVPTSLYPVVAHAETAGQEASTAKAVLEDGILSLIHILRTDRRGMKSWRSGLWNS